MKKFISILIVLTLVLSIGAVSAFAAQDTANTCFVDADGDGVCDACPNGGVRQMNGSGRRGGQNGGNGSGFVDADGDGICDVCPNGGVRPMNGTGRMMGRNR